METASLLKTVNLAHIFFLNVNFKSCHIETTLRLNYNFKDHPKLPNNNLLCSNTVPASSLAISLCPGRAAWKTDWHDGPEERFLDHLPQLLDPGLFCLQRGGFQDNPLVRYHWSSPSPDGKFALVTLNVLCHSSLGSLRKNQVANNECREHKFKIIYHSEAKI